MQALGLLLCSLRPSIARAKVNPSGGEAAGAASSLLLSPPTCVVVVISATAVDTFSNAATLLADAAEVSFLVSFRILQQLGRCAGVLLADC